MPDTEHPEDYCNRCGGPNVSWVAPSPLWNAVMRGGCINGPLEFNEIICPTCFFILADERGVASEFRVDAQALVPLQTVTPSRRVWNENTQLWEAHPVDVPVVKVESIFMKEYNRRRMSYPPPAEESPLSLNELGQVVGKTWALNLVDRSQEDQLVFFRLVEAGRTYDAAWQAMLVTAPKHNNHSLHDNPMGPNPERTKGQ